MHDVDEVALLGHTLGHTHHPLRLRHQMVQLRALALRFTTDVIQSVAVKSHHTPERFVEQMEELHLLVQREDVLFLWGDHSRGDAQLIGLRRRLAPVSIDRCLIVDHVPCCSHCNEPFAVVLDLTLQLRPHAGVRRPVPVEQLLSGAVT